MLAQSIKQAPFPWKPRILVKPGAVSCFCLERRSRGRRPRDSNSSFSHSRVRLVWRKWALARQLRCRSLCCEAQ